MRIVCVCVRAMNNLFYSRGWCHRAVHPPRWQRKTCTQTYWIAAPQRIPFVMLVDVHVRLFGSTYKHTVVSMGIPFVVSKYKTKIVLINWLYFSIFLRNAFCTHTQHAHSASHRVVMHTMRYGSLSAATWIIDTFMWSKTIKTCFFFLLASLHCKPPSFLT